MKSKLGTLFREQVSTGIHLFDSLVKPILLYASDFWGCLNLPKINPIETLHIQFCKELLGVQKQTVNIGVLLELGRLPLSIYAKKYAIKNWERISLKRQANTLLLTSYDASLESGWASSIQKSFSIIGLENLYSNEIMHTKAPNVQLFLKEKHTFQETALLTLQNMSKLRTYKTLKQNAFFEEYLTSIQNVSDRISLTKFRLSNHKLMIEKGRYHNIKPSERVCPFCPNKVEDEFHFLIKCPTYMIQRQNLLEQIKTIVIEFFNPNDEQFLFWFLLNNPMISHMVGRFIRVTMEVREFLLDSPRNNL